MTDLLRLVVQYGVAIKALWYQRVALFLTVRKYERSIQNSRRDMQVNESSAMRCATQIQHLIAQQQATDDQRAYQIYEDEINTLHTLAGHYRGIADYHKRRINTLQGVVEDIERNGAV